MPCGQESAKSDVSSVFSCDFAASRLYVRNRRTNISPSRESGPPCGPSTCCRRRQAARPAGFRSGSSAGSSTAGPARLRTTSLALVQPTKSTSGPPLQTSSSSFGPMVCGFSPCRALGQGLVAGFDFAADEDIDVVIVGLLADHDLAETETDDLGIGRLDAIALLEGAAADLLAGQGHRAQDHGVVAQGREQDVAAVAGARAGGRSRRCSPGSAS